MPPTGPCSSARARHRSTPPTGTPRCSSAASDAVTLRHVDDDAVVVKTVGSETEADIVCGLLRSAGIECGYRETDAIDSSLEEFTAAGPREILVHPSDLDAARELLADPAGD